MQSVKTSRQSEEIIKKSRFIGLLFRCSSEAEVSTCLNTLRREHSSANHIAFAYRIKTDKGTVCRFHDAGEPSGTAGKPIFKYIEGYDLINVLCVVIRYFGGIKLGAGGLTRAYGNTAKQTIASAELIEFVELATMFIILDYNQLQLFEYKLKKFSGEIISKDFSGQVKLQVQLPESQLDAFLQVYPAQQAK